jgi:hypothetical protein
VAPVPGQHSRALGAAWALAFLSTLAAIVFAAAAVAGWMLHLWPATPATLGIAVALVAGGPLISALLLQGIRKPVPSPKPGAAGERLAGETRFRPQPAVPQPPVAQRPLTPEQAWGRALLEWRDRPLRRS